MKQILDYDVFKEEKNIIIHQNNNAKKEVQENLHNPFIGKYNYRIKKASFKEVEYVRKQH